MGGFGMGAPDIPALSPEQARAELARLAQGILAHDARYYQQDAPSISDAAYDALRARYRLLRAAFPELVPADDPEAQVGAAPAAGFAKVTHTVPMLSLANAFTPDEVAEFLARMRRFWKLAQDAPLPCCAAPKRDRL